MLWTVEAVDILKRLALEGRSASVIAAALGAESRNAVIGKANRIGVRLNGFGGRTSLTGRPAGSSPAAAPRARAPAPPPPDRRAAWTLAQAEIGEMRRVGFEELCGLACRWPLGDPRNEDFSYCGLTPAEGQPYCAGHCRMAYRPPKLRAAPNPRARFSPGPWRLA
jgi:GcrA cell cycle regulator